MTMVFRLGETYPGEPLPPGDSFGVHVAPGLGLLLLVAVHGLREPELAGFRDGSVRLAVGRGPTGLAVVAYQVEGFGWGDGYAANAEYLDPGELEDRRELAQLWAGMDGRGAVVGVLVDRDAADAVAALRYMSMSTHVTNTLGRVLVGVYDLPAMTMVDFSGRVDAHQLAHPDPGKWARSHAPGTCRGGD